MQPTTRFALETHAGPYASWPPTSRLLVDGALQQARVPGYVIDAQYATAHGALLVTSHDCLFEESSEFLLLDDALRVVSRRALATPYDTWLLDGHWPEGDGDTLVLHYQRDVFFRLRVMPPRRWWPRHPWLRLRRVDAWRAEPRLVAAQDALRARLEDIAQALESDRAPPR